MPRVSPFHEHYKKHKGNLNEEIHTISLKEFCKKYEIGGTIYNLYFGGKKKRVYTRSIYMSSPEEQIRRREEAIMKRDQELRCFKKNRKALAEKFGKPISYIQSFVNKGFAISEISAGHLVDGELIVKDLIVLRMD